MKIKVSVNVENRKAPRKPLYIISVLSDSYGDFYSYIYGGGRTFLGRKKKLYRQLLTHRKSYDVAKNKRVRTNIKILTKDYLKQNYRQGCSVKTVAKLAKKHKVGKSTIYSYLHRYGLVKQVR